MSKRDIYVLQKHTKVVTGKSSKSSVSRRKFIATTGALSAVGVTGCIGGGSDSGSSSDVKKISGAGSSFVNPLMQQWAKVYYKNNKIKVNYQSIGSGGGQHDLIKKTVQFAGSDAPLSTDQYKQLQKNGGVVHVPESLGAIVPVFNVKGVDKLKITGEVLADIFMGNINKWNDSKLKKLNPDASLPSADITVAHRSDSSGTTYGFTGYLSKVSSKWKNNIGQSKSPSWPTGIGGKGNEGVASVMKKQQNAIGYVELTYATENNIDMFTMKNKSGNWVDASLKGVSAAANGAIDSLPKGDADWSSVSISNASGKKTWPISTFTYLIMYKDMGKAYDNVSKAKAQAVANFAKWVVTDGQQYSNKLKYPKLPEKVTSLDKKTLQSMQYKGNSIL